MGSYSPRAGCQWASYSGATSTANKWPSNGAGGVTATNTSSVLFGAAGTKVFGLLLTATANGNIVISNYAGTALHTIAVTTTTVVPQYIPIGGPEGISVATSISSNPSASGIDYALYFERSD